MSELPTTRELFGAGPRIEPEVDLGRHVGAAPFRYMAGETSAAHAVARAIHLRLACLGTPVEYPDPAALAEGGDDPAAVALALAWDLPVHDPKEGDEQRRARLKKASEQPPDARNFRVTAVHRIVGVGGDALADAKAALCAGYPVIVTTPTDKAFHEYAGGEDLTVPVGDPEDPEERATVLLVGYDRKNRLRGVGWWEGWGEKGRGPLFWAGPEWLASNRLDKLVVGAHALRVAHPYAR